jgi:hypothetical protein
MTIESDPTTDEPTTGEILRARQAAEVDRYGYPTVCDVCGKPFVGDRAKTVRRSDMGDEIVMHPACAGKPRCDSCGRLPTEDNSLITCREQGLVDDEVYRYCEECYQP